MTMPCIIRLFTTFLLCIALHPTAIADAENPVMLWTVSDLANPESAVFDRQREVIYVSNINGASSDKDGNGFISKVSVQGEILELKWVEGMDAPKGMALHDGKLYISDIDRLVVVDVNTAKIVHSYDTPGAKFLNDVAAGVDGAVFVSDTFTNTIHRLHDDLWQAWLEDDALDSPNGLWHGGDFLMVASWGSAPTDKIGTGGVLRVNLKDKTISRFSEATFGHLDGLEKDIDGDFYVTDWVAGLLYHVELDGHHDLVMELAPSSADIGYIAELDMLLVPIIKANLLHAFKMHGPGE